MVIATHNPIAGVASSARADLFQTKLALYTSYVVAGRVTRDTVPTRSSGIRRVRITTCGPNPIVIISS